MYIVSEKATRCKEKYEKELFSWMLKESELKAMEDS